MTKQELEVSLNRFKAAIDSLLELQDKKLEEAILRDATIQRFEFTYELCWKTCKMHLRYKGISATSPREVFEQVFRQGLISKDDEFIFLNMLQDRNLTSHIYKESTAKEVYGRIQTDYMNAFPKLLEKLS